MFRLSRHLLGKTNIINNRDALVGSALRNSRLCQELEMKKLEKKLKEELEKDVEKMKDDIRKEMEDFKLFKSMFMKSPGSGSVLIPNNKVLLPMSNQSSAWVRVPIGNVGNVLKVLNDMKTGNVNGNDFMYLDMDPHSLVNVVHLDLALGKSDIDKKDEEPIDNVLDAKVPNIGEVINHRTLSSLLWVSPFLGKLYIPLARFTDAVAKLGGIPVTVKSYNVDTAAERLSNIIGPILLFKVVKFLVLLITGFLTMNEAVRKCIWFLRLELSKKDAETFEAVVSGLKLFWERLVAVGELVWELGKLLVAFYFDS